MTTPSSKHSPFPISSSSNYYNDSFINNSEEEDFYRSYYFHHNNYNSRFKSVKTSIPKPVVIPSTPQDQYLSRAYNKQQRYRHRTEGSSGCCSGCFSGNWSLEAKFFANIFFIIAMLWTLTHLQFLQHEYQLWSTSSSISSFVQQHRHDPADDRIIVLRPSVTTAPVSSSVSAASNLLQQPVTSTNKDEKTEVTSYKYNNDGSAIVTLRITKTLPLGGSQVSYATKLIPILKEKGQQQRITPLKSQSQQQHLRKETETRVEQEQHGKPHQTSTFKKQDIATAILQNQQLQLQQSAPQQYPGHTVPGIATGSSTSTVSTLPDPSENPLLVGLKPCHYDNLKITGIDPNQDIPSAFPSRNLVIGIAANIDIRNFAIFCGSLRDSHIDATVILFLNERIPKEHAKVAKDFNIILLVYDRQQLEPAFLRTYHPSTLRWILFDWFFTLENGRYASFFDRILALDVRDSAFQADPFQYFDFRVDNLQKKVLLSTIPTMGDANALESQISKNETALAERDSNILYVFGENRAIPISQCAWNRGWVQDCFGDKIYQLIQKQPISCSGISMGGAKRMIHYFNLMSQVMLNNFPCLPSSKFPTCERNGVDQGVHNVLLHLNYLAPVFVKYPDVYPIVNLQSSPELMMETTSVNAAKDAIYMASYMPPIKFAVVHQYDRDSVFQLKLGKKYLPSINWDSPIADWAETETCTSNFGVIFGVDFLKGQCDSGAVRGMTPASCCDACMNQRRAMLEKNSTIWSNKACTAFSYMKGVCYLKHCPLDKVKSNVESIMKSPNLISSTEKNSEAVAGYFKVSV